MSASPTINEAPNFELEIADNSADVELQENSERSFNDSSVSFDALQKQGNANVSGEGAQLSKRALKRVLLRHCSGKGKSLVLDQSLFIQPNTAF